MAEYSIVEQFAARLEEAQRQVVDFIAFLQTRYHSVADQDAKSQRKLADEPFVGMWQDCEDMNDDVDVS